jgi:UDPglucose 6-dehydrogenase
VRGTLLVIAKRLVELGARVRAFDPEATKQAKNILGSSIEYAGNMYDAVEGADALVLLTEWKQFNARLAAGQSGHATTRRRRNIYEPDRLRADGFEYHGMGRSQG